MNSDLKALLKPFTDKRDLVESRVKSGIEANRKGTAFIRFVDKDGKPLAVRHVKITQKTHAFRYGANLFMLDEFSKPEQNAAYKDLFANAFNIATLPFYWDDLEPEPGKPRFAKDSPRVYRRPAPDLCLEWCEQHGIEPKAHCLNYEFFRPKWLPADINTEKRLLEKRFRELAERYAMRIPRWEVTNETYWRDLLNNGEHPLYRSPDLVEWSFKTAEKYFGGNILTINEGQTFAWSGDYFFFSRSPYYLQIENALLKGARIDAIGMQFHMFKRREEALEKTMPFYNPENLYAVLDTYAAFGKPIHITELTIPAYSNNPEDEELQAEILRNLYSIWFSHPAMDAIIYWNLIDGFAAWAPQGDMTVGENYYYGGLIRYDFTPKPAYKMICDLFQKEWRTNLEKTPEGADKISFTGFYGDYELEVTTADGKTAKVPYRLAKLPNPAHGDDGYRKISL